MANLKVRSPGEIHFEGGAQPIKAQKGLGKPGLIKLGLIALMGVDAETGVCMHLYLDLAYDSRRDKGFMKTKEDLRHAIVEGAAKDSVPSS